MQRKFLDHRVGKQFPGKLLQCGKRRSVGRPGELELKTLSLAYSGHGSEAQAMGRAQHRLTLRVVNLWLEHYVYYHSGHVSSESNRVYTPGPAVDGDPVDGHAERSGR